ADPATLSPTCARRGRPPCPGFVNGRRGRRRRRLAEEARGLVALAKQLFDLGAERHIVAAELGEHLVPLARRARKRDVEDILDPPPAIRADLGPHGRHLTPRPPARA